MNILRKYLDKEIEKIYFRVWAPYGEEDLLHTDIGLVLKFKNFSEPICFFSKGDSVKVENINLPFEIYNFTSFKERMQNWYDMKYENINYEFYDFTKSEFFEYFIGKTLNTVNLVYLDRFFVGFRIEFDDDYIMILEYVDGTTVETKKFNKNDVLKMGDVRFEKYNLKDKYIKPKE